MSLGPFDLADYEPKPHGEPLEYTDLVKAPGGVWTRVLMIWWSDVERLVAGGPRFRKGTQWMRLRPSRVN